MSVFHVIFFGFVPGVLTVLALEAALLVFLIRWLSRKPEKVESKLNSSASATDIDQSHFYNNLDSLWIFEYTKVPKGWAFDKVVKKQRSKNERKSGKILDHCLVLTDPDGSQTKIPLRGCKVEAVSVSGLASRKWDKRFPLKVEGEKSDIYKGCKTVFIYLETSLEKESWCKALRLASCEDKEKLDWVTKLSEKFQNYVTALNTEYPSFISADPVDWSLRIDGSSLKVRQLLKKLAKKAPNSMPRSPSSSSFDEGTLCWNLLISRLFFDAKNNMQMKTALQSRIQIMLSKLHSPSYIGEITCNSVDIGNVPPHIRGMRVVALNMDEVWAFEIDIEYAGGAALGVEIRLKVGKLDSQEGEELNNESSPVGLITSDLLKGSEDSASATVLKNERDSKPDDSTSCKTATQALSKWKSMLHSVAKQVSQVPIGGGIKVTSFRGTMRLSIKPPPSDQVWFGFTTMPDVDLGLEYSLGDRKFKNGRFTSFLFNQLKTAIRETLVLPNCESVYIPWMLAEKDDWVPLPTMCIHQDPVADTTTAKRSVSINDEQSLSMENDDMRPLRLGSRERMLGLRKKMGEKQEEKRRDLEERWESMMQLLAYDDV